ncbi:unnamed protein product [Urochloa humidicola]
MEELREGFLAPPPPSPRPIQTVPLPKQICGAREKPAALPSGRGARSRRSPFTSPPSDGATGRSTVAHGEPATAMTTGRLGSALLGVSLPKQPEQKQGRRSSTAHGEPAGIVTSGELEQKQTWAAAA